MALVRVYCGLASADTGVAGDDGWLTAAVVDDAGRLLDVCEIGDDAQGYATLSALLAERSGAPAGVAVAADSDDHLVTMLLTTAGRPLAVVDDDAADDYAERFADDESPEEIESAPAERRAVGLARALQAGALSAHAEPAPRDLAGLKPVLAAHAAMTQGRHGAAGALREVLRELYPAALRAYPDPAERVALAVLDLLPEPGMLTAPASGRNRDTGIAVESIAAQLAATGAVDHSGAVEAVTSLRVAIAETPRRGAANKHLTAATAETVRQAVAAVNSCDAACAALIATVADRVATPAPPTTKRKAPAVTALRSVREPAEPPRRRGRTPLQPVSAAPAPLPPGFEPTPISGMPIVIPQPAAAAPLAPPQPQPVRPVSPAPVVAHAMPQPQPVAQPVTTPQPVPSQRTPLDVPLEAMAVLGDPLAGLDPLAVRTEPMRAEPMRAEPLPARGERARTDRARGDQAKSDQVRSDRVRSGQARTGQVRAEEFRGEEFLGDGFRGDEYRTDEYRTDEYRGGEYRGDGFLGEQGRVDYDPLGTAETPADKGKPFVPTLTQAAINSARAERLGATGDAGPSALDEQGIGVGATEVVLPLSRPSTPPPMPSSMPSMPSSMPSMPSSMPPVPPVPSMPDMPGSRSSWPLVGEREERSGVNGYDSGSYDKVTPPWLADDLILPEPPPLRLVDASALEEPLSPRPPRRNGEAPVADDGDGDLLIFSTVRSAWFTGHSEDLMEEPTWNSAMDVGWQAAEHASSPLFEQETRAGLPKRVPQANLVPGSPIAAPERPLRIVRDPQRLAQHTSGYFRGWRRGQEVNGYAVGGRPGRESANGWDFSRDDERDDYGYRTAGYGR